MKLYANHFTDLDVSCFDRNSSVVEGWENQKSCECNLPNFLDSSLLKKRIILCILNY